MHFEGVKSAQGAGDGAGGSNECMDGGRDSRESKEVMRVRLRRDLVFLGRRFG